jgi:hypothetical protein
VIDRLAKLIAFDPNAAGRITLGIAINEKRPLFSHGQTRGQIYGGGCLPYAAFLVRDRNYTRHWICRMRSEAI